MAHFENHICKRNQNGYCKFRDHCRQRHENQLCVNEICEDNHCEKRHPKTCSFFKQYKMCKFGEFCKYKHEACENIFEKKILNEILEIKEKIKSLEKHVIEKDIIIDNLTIEILNFEENKSDNVIEEDISDSLYDKNTNSSIKLNCDCCDFQAKKEKGSKTHKG